MLKYWPEDTSVTFSEIPDQIALCVNITQCPGMCEQCSEKWLQEDKGPFLTTTEIDSLIVSHPDCTVFVFMGGDNDHQAVASAARYIKDNYKNLKVGMYSGFDYIDLELVPYLDFYKIGRWIAPNDNKADWPNHSWGPLVWPVSNQRYFEKIGNRLVDATYKFRRQPISDWSRYIIK